MSKNSYFESLNHPKTPLEPTSKKVALSTMKGILKDVESGQVAITCAGVTDGEGEYDGMSHYILTTIKTEHSPKEET